MRLERWIVERTFAWTAAISAWRMTENATRSLSLPSFAWL